MTRIYDFQNYKQQKALERSISESEPLVIAVRTSWTILLEFAHYRAIKNKIIELQELEDDIERSLIRKRLKLEEIQRNSLDKTE